MSYGIILLVCPLCELCSIPKTHWRNFLHWFWKHCPNAKLFQPLHFQVAIRGFLDKQFPWKGSKEAAQSPGHLDHLIEHHFFFWEHVKDAFHVPPLPTILPELVGSIHKLPKLQLHPPRLQTRGTNLNTRTICAKHLKMPSLAISKLPCAHHNNLIT